MRPSGHASDSSTVGRRFACGGVPFSSSSSSSSSSPQSLYPRARRRGGGNHFRRRPTLAALTAVCGWWTWRLEVAAAATSRTRRVAFPTLSSSSWGRTAPGCTRGTITWTLSGVATSRRGGDVGCAPTTRVTATRATTTASRCVYRFVTPPSRRFPWMFPAQPSVVVSSSRPRQASIMSHPPLDIIATDGSDYDDDNEDRQNVGLLDIGRLGSSSPTPMESTASTNEVVTTKSLTVGEGTTDDPLPIDETQCLRKPPLRYPKKNTRSNQSPHHSHHWRHLLQVASQKSRSIRGSNYVQLATVDLLTHEPRCRTVVFRGFTPVHMNVPQPHSPPVENHDVDHQPTEMAAVVANDRESCHEEDHSHSSSWQRIIQGDGHAASTSDKTYSCVMKMITDGRSAKVSEINGSPSSSRHRNNAELVWWLPRTSEQFRIRGTIVLVGATADEKEIGAQAPAVAHNDRHLTQLRLDQWNHLTDAARQPFLSDIPPGDPYTGGDEPETINPEPTSAATTPPMTDGHNANLSPPLPPPHFLLMLLVPNYCDYLRLTDQYRQIDQYDHDTRTWTSQRVNA